MATETKTFYPSSYDTSDYTATSISGANNVVGKGSDTTSSSYAKIAGGYVQWPFDVSAIPDDAEIESVACKVKGRSSSSTDPGYLFLVSGSTQKGTSYSMGTSLSVHTLSVGSWTREELKSVKLRARMNVSNTSKYLLVYGADLTVTYTYQSEKFMLKLGGSWTDVARVFKKVSGIWVEQTDLANVVDQTKRLVNGGEYVRPVVIINFTVGSTALQAEEGMTWAEWCGSDYDTTTYNYAVASNGYVNLSDEAMWLTTSDGSHVKGSDTVIAGHVYNITPNDPS